ncbi:MAG TPA: pilin [bacterium]|nr:pilin [bacterium]
MKKIIFLTITFSLLFFIKSSQAQISCDESIQNNQCVQGGICINCPSGAPSNCGSLNGFFCIQDPNSCSFLQQYNYAIGRCDNIPCAFASSNCPSGSVCSAISAATDGFCVDQEVYASQQGILTGSCETNDDCAPGFECVFVSMTEGKRCSLEATLKEEKNEIFFTPQITIPGSDFKKGNKIKIEESTKTIGLYIISIYNYLLAIVGLLATIVLMVAGVVWMTSGGNTERISSAKGWIIGALTGLFLLLLSYVILRTINPNLVDFRDPGFEKIGEIILLPDFEIKEYEMEQDTTGRDAYNPNNDPIMRDIEECEARGENYVFVLTTGQCEELQSDSNSEECPCPEGQNDCIINDVFYDCADFE